MNKWSVPADLTSFDVGFGPKDDIHNYIPAWDEIPIEYKGNIPFYGSKEGKWIDFVSDVFFKGVKNIRCVVKDKTIDQEKATRHLSMLLRSFDLKHEHKISGAAYLASLWFDDITYTTEEKEE